MKIMSNNSIFGGGLSYNPNPFANVTPSVDESLMNSYAQLEALKRKYSDTQIQQQPQQVTVFTDIDNELKGLSEDELAFITNSKDYQAASSKYQTEFSQFLINKFSNEYLQTGNTRTLEEMLYVIRKEKENYKGKFAADINEIRDQNKSLVDRNNELAENNAALQRQLEEIKNRLWKD
jgi:molybdopterin converting factor small subunit